MNSFLDIEPPMRDAECMASILTNLLHAHFASDPSKESGHPDLYRLSDQEVSNLLYASGHLCELIGQTKEAFYKANGEQVKGGVK
ncbi:hypothetical protein [Brucella sp. IR073]|uniref:hypothetical protein n=1 Tax=unclassified Brucella TaxID=2632610 RepID=UPI003B98421F